PAPSALATRTWDRPRLNPRFTFLVYIAFALGTIPLDAMLRTTILWVVLALLVLAHIASHPLQMPFAIGRVRNGALIGLVLTLPLAFLVRDVLLTIAVTSLGTAAGLLIFQRMVFIAAPLEEAYYRGCLQREHSALEATLLYALGALALYFPIAQGFWLVLGTLVLGSLMLGVLFAWVSERYGLSAAMACHIVCNFSLFVAPTLLRDWGHLLR
ncbi:MAG: CPBP family intramembrane metalloprotease, partial [Chloroflexi bacterium]|nr:CPBP family intramembrane metalloprotease [Chloroflexota bacterium]